MLFPEIRTVHRRPLQGQQPQKRLLPEQPRHDQKVRIISGDPACSLSTLLRLTTPKGVQLPLYQSRPEQATPTSLEIEDCLRFALRRNEVQKVNVAINHFLRASNAY